MRYPIYVISKGRSDCCLTAKFLIKDGVQFTLVIEPQEENAYRLAGYGQYLLLLPFSNLGLGSIPARNFVWEHAKAAGFERHWIIDDNIREFWRRSKAQRVRCSSVPCLSAAEDFTDRYENVAITGFNYFMFIPEGAPCAPFVLNVHVYSCMLIKNSLEFRWRGRYNEDTDLCLQVLSAGWCTILFNAFAILKMPTMTMKGGNTAELYQGDGRLTMARSLERQWPGVVTTQRRFKRPQHVIKDAWKKFDTPLKRRADIDFSKFSGDNEYGMTLRKVQPAKTKTPERPA